MKFMITYRLVPKEHFNPPITITKSIDECPYAWWAAEKWKMDGVNYRGCIMLSTYRVPK